MPLRLLRALRGLYRARVELVDRIHRLLGLFGIHPYQLAPLARWALLSAIVGGVVGFAMIVLHHLIELLTELLFEELPEAVKIPRPVLLIGCPTIGGFLVSLIAKLLAPEVKGSGTGPMMRAYHREWGFVRNRVPPLKLLASALTIGTGGSAGYEGPAVQIGGGIGSVIARWLRLGARERKILVIAGIAAGIGSIFKAPLAGAFFAIELPYRYDLEVVALLPAVIASAVGYSIYASATGWGPRFMVKEWAFSDPCELPVYAAGGIMLGLLAVVYARVFRFVHRLFEEADIPEELKPPLGGALTGLLGLVNFKIMGLGYSTIQAAFNSNLPGVELATLPFLKILATSLTVGSGGSGGLLAPALFIGAVAGAAVGTLFHQILPALIPDPGAMALVGMGAFLAGAAKTPLTAIVLIGEMTGNYRLLVPEMVTVAFAYVISGENTIIEEQAERRLPASV